MVINHVLERNFAILILVAGSLFAGLTAAWLPMSALHQDSDTAIVPTSGELRIPLLVQAPLVLGGQVSLEAFPMGEGEGVVFQFFFNGRLMAQGEGLVGTSFIVDETRASTTSLVFVAMNRGAMPVGIFYYADALRPAFPSERLILGALLFLPLGTPVAVHQATLRLMPERTSGSRGLVSSLFLTGWVFLLYAEILVGFPLLVAVFNFQALRGFLGFLLLLSFRTPFGLLPVFSAAVGLVLGLRGRTLGRSRWWRFSIFMGVGGLALLVTLFILSQGLGR